VLTIQQFTQRSLKSNNPVMRYGVAIASVLVVLCFRSVLHPLLVDKIQYSVFLLAVVFSAWYSGGIPALVALALGAFLGNTFFVAPYHTLKIGDLSDALAISSYVLIGIAIIYLFEVVKRREAQLTVQIIKQAEVEKALRMSEDRFRLVTEALQGAVYDWDATKDIAYRSPAIFDIVGYKGDEIKDTRKWWQDLMHPDDFEGVQQSLQKRLAERAPIHSIEYRVRHKDGHYLWVWDKSRILYNAEGQLTRLIGCTLSIDERKQAEDALYARYQLTTDLAEVVSTEDVAQVMVDHLMQQTGAKVGVVYVYHRDNNMFELLYANAAWAASGGLNGWQRFSADPRYPMTDVVKNNKSLWFSTIEAYETEYPVVKQYTHLNPGATVLLPLVVASEVFGEISLLFSEPQTFTEYEQAFIMSLVFQCAQAIERARLAEKTRALAVIEERHRLARDLHDNVSQLLFSSSVISEMLPRLLTTKPDKALEQSEALHLMVRGAMAEMRTLLWELRPESIVQTKLSGLLTQLGYAAESRQDANVSLNFHAVDEVILPADAQVAFYRIAQESIHNIFKHGHATTISIRLRQTGQYTALMIADDGHGFDAGVDSPGFGLRNMHERATNIGAQFDVKSQLGKGTRIRLLWNTPI
jgi:PAS domain S-box-containing protein